MTTPNQRIAADLESLRVNRVSIGSDTDDTLAPGLADAHGRIFRGLHLGDTTQSGEVEAARRALAYAMERFWRNGVAHVERARQAVAFLDKILAEYRNTDDFAKLNVDKVLADLEAVAPRPSNPPVQLPGDVA